METIVSAVESSSRAVVPQRVDDSAQASKRREAQTQRAVDDLEKQEPKAGKVEKKEPSASKVYKAAERLNEALQEFDQDLNISIHQDTGQMVVQVKDSSGKVIRQVPTEQLLEAEVNIDKIIGLFVDNRV